MIALVSREMILNFVAQTSLGLPSVVPDGYRCLLRGRRTRRPAALDSPHNRNALSARLVAQLHDGLRRAES